MMRKITLLTVLAASSTLTSNATAGGFATARFGGEHGHPTTDNPTAIYYNPAGVAASRGVNIFADGILAWRSVYYTPNGDLDNAAKYPDAIGSNTSTAGLFNFAGAPMLGATARYDISESIGLAAGAAFMVPFGGGAKWDKNNAYANHAKYPGPVDGSQRWYAIDGTLKTMYISGSLGVSLMRDRLYIGISGGPALSDVKTVRAREATGGTDLNTEGRVLMSVKGMHGQLGGGVMYKALENDKLTVGLSYQAPPGFGRMKLDGTLEKKLGQSLTIEDVDYYQTLPDIFRFGLKSRINSKVELRLFADYQRWSLVDYQCVSKDNEDCVIKLTESRGDGDPGKGAGLDNQGAPNSAVTIGTIREWNDSFGVRAGASYWVKPTVEVFVGAGYDSNAVPDSSIDPVLFDMHDVSLALGGRIALTDYLHGSLSYAQIFYISRDTPAGSSTNSTYAGPSKWPEASGRYEQSIGVLNINLQASFDVFGQKKKDAPVSDEPVAPVEAAPAAPVEAAPAAPVEAAPAAPVEAAPAAPAEAAPADAPKAAPAEAAPAEPKADEPKADAPKADAPKADAPKADAPKADAPKADAPAPKATP